MAYTVKQLASISGVSIRTLHHYDDIGLLKPAYCGTNKYRYYGENELLRLQQILFYKQLGFKLNEIQRVLDDINYDKISALGIHKNRLEAELLKTQALVKTIDALMDHLEGNKVIQLEDIFKGFTESKQRYYENHLVDQGLKKDKIERAKEKTKNWSKERWSIHKKASHKVYIDLVSAIRAGYTPGSAHTLGIIKRHYELVKVHWMPTRESYIALSDLYASDSGFVKFHQELNPQLPTYLCEAMTLFAKTKLRENTKLHANKNPVLS